MMRRWLARSLQVLVAALLLGLPLGALAAAVRARPYDDLRDVVWPLLADGVQQGVLAALAALVAWLAIHRISRSAALATVLALGAPALYVAYRVNVDLLPGFFEFASLGANAAMALALLVGGALGHAVLRRWREEAWETPRAPVGAFACLAAAPLGLHLAGHGPRDPGPDVLVILVDILRADHLGCYGYERPTSPHIDRLAADSVLFEQAISSATFTKTSVASLFTGLYPHHHGVYEGTLRAESGYTSDVLSERFHTLAESVRDLGLHTVAWVQNGQLRAYMGFDQGFALYRDQPGDAVTIAREFREWGRDWARRTRYFAYLHLIDLHGPFNPGPPHRGRFGPVTGFSRDFDMDAWREFKHAVNARELPLSGAELEELEARHDEQLAWVDEQVGRILDDLRESGRYDDTLIVLTSDHGEAFWEHGFIAHAKPPYEEVVHVPLIVKLPGSRHAGRRVERMVGLVDLAPTLIEWLGGEPPEGLDGASFLPALGDVEVELEPRVHFMEHHRHVGVRTERWKLIRRSNGELELYDLAADPGEQRECSASHPDVVQQLSAAIERAREARERLATDERVEVDPETLEALRGLGYL